MLQLIGAIGAIGISILIMALLDKKTSLYSAVANGHAEVVAALLAAGADIEARAEGGLTPLHSAVANGHTEVVAALLAAGADIEARAEGGLTPLHSAVANGHSEAVAALLAAGADIEARAARLGFTSLHLAAQKGSTEVVLALLDGGADGSAIDTLWRTPFALAKERNRKKLEGTAAWWRLNEAHYR